MILLIVFLTLLVIGLVYIVMDCGDAESITKIIVNSILFVIGISFSIMTLYASNIQDIEKLKANKINVLSNYKSLAVNLNKKAVVKTSDKTIIIDVVNMSQSKEASSAYISWVDNVNSYNNTLAKEKGARAAGFYSFFMYGPLPKLPDDLTYIELKNLD